MEKVHIDDPALRAAAEIETNKERAAAAFDFLYPAVDTYFENLREVFARNHNAEIEAAVEKAFHETVSAMRESRFSAFDFLRKRYDTQKKSGGKNVSMTKVEEMVAITGYALLKKMEALVEGKKMSINLNYFDPKRSLYVKSFSVDFIPEWRGGRFLVGKILPKTSYFDANRVTIADEVTPLKRIEKDFNFKPGVPVPIEDKTFSIDEK